MPRTPVHRHSRCPQPFNPVEAAAGTNNTFTNVCYSIPANYPGLPHSVKNCPGS